MPQTDQSKRSKLEEQSCRLLYTVCAFFLGLLIAFVYVKSFIYSLKILICLVFIAFLFILPLLFFKLPPGVAQYITRASMVLAFVLIILVAGFILVAFLAGQEQFTPTISKVQVHNTNSMKPSLQTKTIRRSQ